MANVLSVLVDETPFVFITRNDGGFELKAELARFIEKCAKNNSKAEFKVFSTKNVQKRLGYGWLYNSFQVIARKNINKSQLLQKRRERRSISKKIIVRFLSVRRLGLKPVSWKLMDLHLFANENKRASLKRLLLPQEVIPIDMCINALIAHQNNFPIFSFNEDYQYFLTMPGGKEPFLQYWKPADILKQLSV